MNKQEIFDKVCEHLMKQGVPAMDGNSCSYRAEDGKVCAVGCLISDEDYKPSMEGSSVDTLNLFHNVDRVTMHLLVKLQATHDFWLMEGRRKCASKLRQVALEFGLKAKCLDSALERYE